MQCPCIDFVTPERAGDLRGLPDVQIRDGIERLDFASHPVVVPIELRTHDLRHGPGGLAGGSRVENQAPAPAGKNVVDGAGHLLPARPDDLGSGQVERGMDALGEVTVAGDHLFDLYRVGAVDGEPTVSIRMEMPPVDLQLLRHTGVM